MLRYWFIILLLVGCASVSVAQQEVLYYGYQLNPLAINPAVAGSRETFHLAAMFRSKLSGGRNTGNGAITQSVALDGAIANGAVGLGFQAVNDRINFLGGATGLYGSVAYRFSLPALAKLAVGVQGGVSFLPFSTGTGGGSFNQAQGSFGVGVYYRADRWFAGVSMPELLRGKLDFGLPLYAVKRPLFVQVGTRLDVAEEMVLIPSVVITSMQNQPTGVDVNAKLWYQETFGLGASYRSKSGIAPEAYLQITAEVQVGRAIRVGYAYNSRTPENQTATAPGPGVHDILFRFTPGLLKFTY
jgi:type IX secretion system PorP/SprF family membrane protein